MRTNGRAYFAVNEIFNKNVPKLQSVQSDAQIAEITIGLFNKRSTPPPPSEKINNTPSPLQTSYTNLNIFWMIPLPSLDGRNFLHWWVMGLKFSKFSREHLTLGMCLQHLHHAPPLTSCTSHWKSPQLQTCIGAVPIYTD